MRNKVLATFFGGLLLVAAASPAPAQKDSFLEAMKFCDAAMKVYRSGPVGQQKVADAMAAFQPTERNAMAVVCRAYTIGYDQGQRDYVKNIA